MKPIFKICRPGTRRKLAGALGLLLALGLLATTATPAYGEITPAHMFYGTVTVNGSPAVNGTIVEASITGSGVLASQETVDGAYGYAVQFLVPYADGRNGKQVDFYVGGIYAASYTFASSAQTLVNLSVSGEPAPPDYDLVVTSDGCCDIEVAYDSVTDTVSADSSKTYNNLPEDTEVTLTATGGCEYCQFDGWELDGSPAGEGSNEIMVVMDGDHSATATCQVVLPPTYDLVVTSDGCCDIEVAYDSETDTVGADSSKTYNNLPEGTEVTLTATGGCENCQFSGWVKDEIPVVDGSNEIMVVMDDDHSVTAVCEVVELPEVTTVEIVEGWNTFSIPYSLAPETDTWGEFKTWNGLSFTVVLRYDTTDKVWESCADGDMIELLEGYYIYAVTGGDAEFVPNPEATPPPMRTLVNGLNCIGVASFFDVSAKSYLVTVEGTGDMMGYKLVLNPPINGGGWVAYVRADASSPLLKIGKAYWVVMSTSEDLYGFTSTPVP